MTVRGIRGAITVDENAREAILEGTGELLQAMVEENNVAVEDIASCHFTTSPDLNAEFPAEATRRLEGWKYVPAPLRARDGRAGIDAEVRANPAACEHGGGAAGDQAHLPARCPDAANRPGAGGRSVRTGGRVRRLRALP